MLIRLADFTCGVIKFVEGLPAKESKYVINNQITRSSLSVSLNFAEAQSSESRKDFIHKINVSLKELRETKMALIIISRLFESNHTIGIDKLIREGDELIAIFVTSINTAQKNLLKHKR